MILGMAFPNILGLILLSDKVKNDLNNYKKLKETKQKNLTSSF
jgi:Na+/alanine symporter